MSEIKDKIILAVKKAIANRAEVVDCYHDIMEIDYNDVDYIAEQAADALIAAGFGDVTEYKEIIRDINTDVVAYRALSKADTLEQIIEGQKSLIDEYRHRAEVAERALRKAVSVLDAEYRAFGVNRENKTEQRIKNFIEQAEKELAKADSERS